jgi:hypothetical protein
MIKALVGAGADPTRVAPRNYFTPLSVAARETARRPWLTSSAFRQCGGRWTRRAGLISPLPRPLRPLTTSRPQRCSWQRAPTPTPSRQTSNPRHRRPPQPVPRRARPLPPPAPPPHPGRRLPARPAPTAARRRAPAPASMGRRPPGAWRAAALRGGREPGRPGLPSRTPGGHRGLRPPARGWGRRRGTAVRSLRGAVGHGCACVGRGAAGPAARCERAHAGVGGGGQGAA